MISSSVTALPDSHSTLVIILFPVTMVSVWCFKKGAAALAVEAADQGVFSSAGAPPPRAPIAACSATAGQLDNVARWRWRCCWVLTDAAALPASVGTLPS